MFTLTKETVYEEEIKKSRFIVKAMPVASVANAMAYLERVQEERATHNCWAYIVGEEHRFSDDGEPGGTAGKPIYSAIERQDIIDVMVVVVRYFGGIKLGAGGLVRAYGGCAAKCLQGARLKQVIVTQMVSLKVGFEDMGVLYPIIERFGAEKTDENYTPTGLEIGLRVNQENIQAMLAALNDASAGRIETKVQQKEK